jgi:hypothetical protein
LCTKQIHVQRVNHNSPGQFCCLWWREILRAVLLTQVALGLVRRGKKGEGKYHGVGHLQRGQDFG